MSVPTQIQYRAIEPTACPKYKYFRQPSTNKPSASTVIQGTTSDVFEWKLPTDVINLHESYLTYQVVVPAQAGVACWVYEDCLDIATNINLQTGAGTYLCNLDYVNRHSKIARKIKTKFSDYMSNDVTSQLSPCNTLGTANFYPVTSGNPSGGVTTTMNYTEPTYLATAGVDTQIDSLGTRMFPLSGLKDTIFAVNKDLWFPTDTFLRMTLGVGNLIAFQSTSATNPTTGAAAISGNITIQNVNLYLAVEKNPDIIKNIKETVLSSGLKLLIPYTTGVSTITTSTTGNIQIQLPQNGGKLKKVMHTVWNGTQSGNTALDSANYNGTKISSFQTYMNSNQLQSYIISCATPVLGVVGMDDWRENAKYCKDSVIQNRFVYGLNWFNIDNFCEQIVDNDEDNFVDEGLPMDVTQIWSMQATCANTNLTHYTFMTFGRQIIINRDGVTIF